MTNYIDDLFLKNKEFLNQIIKNIVKGSFRKLDDLSLDNLRNFLIPILKAYEKGLIDHSTLKNIADGLEEFIYEKYSSDYPDSAYPKLPEEDKRFIGLKIIDYIDGMLDQFIIFPEDVSHFIEALQIPIGKEVEGYEKLKKYIKSFNFSQRLQEAKERGITG